MSQHTLTHVEDKIGTKILLQQCYLQLIAYRTWKQLMSNTWNPDIHTLKLTPCTRPLKDQGSIRKSTPHKNGALLFSTARIKPSPYKVINVEYDEFYDLEKLTSCIIENTTLDTKNNKVKWLKIKWMRFQKTQPYILQYKYNPEEIEFKKMDTSKSKRIGRKTLWENVSLISKYSKRLPISEAKKKDLQYLLKTKIIPSHYKHFYDNLPTIKKFQPSVSSDDEDTE